MLPAGIADIPNRKLTVFHEGDSMVLSKRIGELNLDSSLVETVAAVHDESRADNEDQSKLLRKVLLINFGCFILEVATGMIAGSMGLKGGGALDAERAPDVLRDSGKAHEYSGTRIESIKRRISGG